MVRSQALRTAPVSFSSRVFMSLGVAAGALAVGVSPARNAAADPAPSMPAAPWSQAAGGPRQLLWDGLARRGERYYAPLEDGGEALLTLEPRLQESTGALLASYDVPLSAAVAVSVPDGRVLALVGRSAEDPSLAADTLAVRPWAPAASVFKIVTAAALVAEGGLRAETRTCYHGGLSAVSPQNLLDLPRLDNRCDTLAFGVGKSQNAILAKLASRHLTPASLGRVAADFGFGAPIPFELEVTPSDAFMPRTPIEFARAAAGFWHTSLSVLHGALVAATIAAEGEMPAPRLIERAVDAAGRPVPAQRRRTRRVLAPEVAREVGRMMVLTTTMGTARSAFRDRRGARVLPVDVAGKTGSLSYRGQEGDPPLPVDWPADTHLGYSWFVGYAPVEEPQIAFAVLVGNRALWHIKAPFVARRIVEEFLAARADARPGQTTAARTTAGVRGSETRATR